jgi:hypothetical protein
MHCEKLKLILVLSFMIALLGSCAARNQEDTSPGPQQEVIETIQPGDGQLTCEELLIEMKRMDRIAYGSPAGANNTNTMVSALTSGASLGFGFIPVPVLGPVLGAVTGPVSSLAGNASQTQNLQQQNTVVQAQQRKQHLVMLYDNENCSQSTPSTE